MTEWADFVDFKCLTTHKLLCWCSVLKYRSTWNQQIQLIPFFFYFWSYFDVVSEASGLLDYINSVSTFASPFLSVPVHFGKLWHRNANELTISEKRLHTTNVHCHGTNFDAKQGRLLCHFSVQYIQHTYSRLLYSVQISNQIIHDYMVIQIPIYFEKPQRYTHHMHPLCYRQIDTSAAYYQQSFYPVTIVLWNRLPPDIVLRADLDTFKEGVCNTDSSWRLQRRNL